MKASELRRRFIDFFVKKHAHAEIPSSSLVPENDPTVLFTTAGMHPLVPYLMGEVHPAGKRLVDAQKCLRTDDIDEVGDATHCTFFEMLGNWSLGDYFKKEAIQWSYEFMMSSREEGGIGLEPNRLMVTCFAGDTDAPRDDEAAGFWQELGFKRYTDASAKDRRLIFFYEKKKNWWGPAGQTGPCGPDTEMFYDLCPELAWNQHKPGSSEASQKRYQLQGLEGKCHPNCECGHYVEIWNDVFMQYNKNADGSFVPLKQQNVDTGMGLERVAAILQGVPSHYETELFAPMKEKVRELATGEKTATSEEEQVISGRIIADHIRAATFIMGDKWGVVPSNKDQGYVLRRLIRRAIRHAKMLGVTGHFTHELATIVIETYSDAYPELATQREKILEEFKREETKFQRTISQGLREMRKIWNDDNCKRELAVENGDKAFFVYETYGFPVEMIKEELKKMGYTIDEATFKKRFDEAQEAHQAKSRVGSEQKFAGGLADHSVESTKLHTATHLLHTALKNVLGKEVEQKGSNITAERLRFDFNYAQKMTPEQLKTVEDMVNKQIERDLPVSFEIIPVEQARTNGAIGVFPDRYDAQVKVYKMGDFSYEICGGPHVVHTGVLGKFKIRKEEAVAAGIRRIKATVEGGANDVK